MRILYESVVNGSISFFGVFCSKMFCHICNQAVKTLSHEQACACTTCKSFLVNCPSQSKGEINGEGVEIEAP